jgi:hypothetical protein
MLVFVGFEIYEFAHYVHEGVNLTIGSYWSSFFILLGTHGAIPNDTWAPCVPNRIKKLDQ